MAVLDPTFNTNQAHAEFVLQARPETLTGKFLDAVAASPANITLELGIQTIIPEELKLIGGRIKGADPSKVVQKHEDKLALVIDRGISHEFSLMYALPRQTPSSFARSIEWCKAHTAQDTAIKAFPLMLLRGTLLHERKQELGLVEGLLPTKYAIQHRLQTFIPHVVATPTINRIEWAEMCTLSAHTKHTHTKHTH